MLRRRKRRAVDGCQFATKKHERDKTDKICRGKPGGRANSMNSPLRGREKSRYLEVLMIMREDAQLKVLDPDVRSIRRSCTADITLELRKDAMKKGYACLLQCFPVGSPRFGHPTCFFQQLQVEPQTTFIAWQIDCILPTKWSRNKTNKSSLNGLDPFLAA